ncbi:MAG: porin [Phycisphaerales bacterium]
MNHRLLATTASAAALLAALPAFGADDDALARMQSQIDALKNANAQQAKEIQELRESNGETWLTEKRAEQIRGVVQDVLSDSSTRASLQGDGATAGYDKNFFIASPDGNFRLNIEGQLQVRYAYNYMPSAALAGANADRSQVQNEYGFELRRVKLNFFGHVFDPSWTYRMQLAYERDGQLSGTPLSFEDVFIQKAFEGGFYVRFGQWKNAFNYEEFASSRTQQFAERSLVNQYYSTKFVQGVMLGWESEALRLYGSYNDGGGNRNMQVIQTGTGNPTEWAFTGRAEYKLAGAWGAFKDMQGWRGSDFGAMLGLAANWQRSGGDAPTNKATVGNGNIPNTTGTGTVETQFTNLTYTADLNLRGDGWSAWAAFLGNYLYGGGAAVNARGVNDSLSYGVVVQGGYFLTDALELVARYEGLWVVSDNTNTAQANALIDQSLNILTIGANYYFAKNAVKLTLDAGYAFNPVRFSNGLFGESISGADWRASQTGNGSGEVVIRAQMQLLF